MSDPGGSHGRAVVVAGVALGLFALGQPAGAQSSGQTLYGLTTNDKIVTFSTDDPDDIQSSVRVTGIGSRESLIGIDRRPLTGDLFAVARSRSGVNLYIVNPSSGRATLVAPLVSAPTATNPNRTPVMLNGTEFGFDFNPAADELRIVGDNGQNLRVIPSPRVGPGGVMLQTGDTFTDGMINNVTGRVSGVTAVAYLNNDNDPATPTTLFDINSGVDTLSIQNPPNDGTLVAVGPLGRSTRPRAGFDIVTQNGTNTAYAALSQRGRRGGQVSRLVVVDTNTGFTWDLGVVGTNDSLRDIAA
ncbi:MAG: DUF4394 domain-containing protein [Acidimicrobiales bacterium]